jgi:arsenical pump membrane protein
MRRLMTPTARVAITLAIFAVTLALVMWKPRGHSEAVWAVLGAAAMLGLGLVTPRDVVGVTLSGKGALLFLAALLPLSALVEASGFFEWAAIHAARRARGDGRVLYRNVFLLGAAVTITLSLDTTAVMLTPLVLAFVARLALPSRPYVIACAFVANTGSLLLPVSNLTNLLFVETFDLGFGPFAARMVLSQIAALAATYGLCRLRFRAELPPRFDTSLLASPAAAVAHRGYFRASALVLGLVFAGYFVAGLAHVEPYVVAFAGVAVLLGYGLSTKRVAPRALLRLSWDLFPFVIGLFVVVRGVENLGVASAAAGWLRRHAAEPRTDMLASAAGTALAANAMNNLPAALVARSAISAANAGSASIYGALLGANIGPNIVPFGSLATMLVLSVARKRGQPLRGVEVLKTGIWMTPLVLLAALAALALSFALVR